MVQDAETHAEEDKKEHELIEARNRADQLVYQTEKTLKEHGDKVAEPERKAIEEALQGLKDVQSGSDKPAIDKAMEELNQASHKLAEEMYKQAQSAQADAAGGAEAEPTDSASSEGQAVEADYEVVDDEKKEA